MGNKTHVAEIARRLAQAGYTAVAVNYRSAPRHQFPAQIEDCRDALAWMRPHTRGHKIDPDRLAEPKAMRARLKQPGVTAEIYVVPQAGRIGAFFNRTAINEGIKFLEKHL